MYVHWLMSYLILWIQAVKHKRGKAFWQTQVTIRFHCMEKKQCMGMVTQPAIQREPRFVFHKLQQHGGEWTIFIYGWIIPSMCNNTI